MDNEMDTANDQLDRMAIVLKATEHYLIGPAFEELRMVKLPRNYANESEFTRLSIPPNGNDFTWETVDWDAVRTINGNSVRKGRR